MSVSRPFCLGEWRVEERTREQQARLLPAYQIVAYLPDEAEEGGLWLADVGINPDDANADAQVMAASKALYEALSALVAACRPGERHLNGTQVYRVEDVRDNGAVEQARAALALVERRA